MNEQAAHDLGDLSHLNQLNRVQLIDRLIWAGREHVELRREIDTLKQDGTLRARVAVLSDDRNRTARELTIAKQSLAEAGERAEDARRRGIRASDELAKAVKRIAELETQAEQLDTYARDADARADSLAKDLAAALDNTDDARNRHAERVAALEQSIMTLQAQHRADLEAAAKPRRRWLP